MTAQIKHKRPTKRELVEAARTTTQLPPQVMEVATLPPPVAPPEPTTAEVAEALDGISSYEGQDDGDNHAGDWFDEPVIDVPTIVETDTPFPSHTPPTPRLVVPQGSLMAHCGTRKITRDELALVPTPEGTRTHQPIAHARVVELLEETLAFRHIRTVREEYAVSPDGARMFGVLDLDYQYATLDTFRFSIGLRNSNDKTMRLGMTIGLRVFVCDNMMFRGDFTPVFAKHTRKLDLEETVALGVDRMQRGFQPLRAQVEGWQRGTLSDRDAKLLIYEAFLDRGLPLPRHLMPVIHRHYFQPEYEAFQARSMWSLTNAFTSAFKLLKPVQQFQATAKLGGFLARYEGNGSASHEHAFVAPAPEALAVSA